MENTPKKDIETIETEDMGFFKQLLLLICYILGELTMDKFMWLALAFIAFFLIVFGLTV